MNGIFQKSYGWFKRLTTPVWLREILRSLQDLIIQITFHVGKDYLDNLKYKIIEVSGKNISSEQKFKEVFNFTKTELKLILKDSWLNLLIEVLVNNLKENETI